MQIMKSLKWDCAHRLHLHENKCAFVHGHTYKMDIFIEGPTLDSVGRLIDFGQIKEDIGNWIDDKWDHAYIYYAQDPISIDLVKVMKKHGFNSRTYKMPYNPTAENMAKYLMSMIIPNLTAKWNLVEVTKIRVWETATAYAEVTKEEVV